MAMFLFNLYQISILFYIMSLMYTAILGEKKNPFEVFAEIEKSIMEDESMSQEAKEKMIAFFERLVTDRALFFSLMALMGVTPILNVLCGITWIKKIYKESRG